MADIKVATAAERLGLSKVSVHKWVKRLTLIEQGLALKENGMVLLTEEALRVIEEAHREKNPTAEKTASQEDVNPTVKVVENPREVNEKLYEQLTDRFEQEVQFLRQELTRRDETVQQLLTKQAEERQRTDSIIMKLAHDLEGTRKAALAIEAKVDALTEKKEISVSVEDLTKPPEPVQVWQPAPPKADPTRNLPWYQRAWVKFVHPERCRRVEN